MSRLLWRYVKQACSFHADIVWQCFSIRSYSSHQYTTRLFDDFVKAQSRISRIPSLFGRAFSMLGMVFLWLCSVAHPVHRVTLHGQRCRLKLPQDEWLQRILQHEGVAVSWHEPKPELTQKFSIVGLIDMDFQSLQVWSGPLTSWSKESMVLHNYYHSPVDSFIIRASSVFCFDEEVPVYTKIDGRSRESAINGSDGIFFPCGVNIERVGSVSGIEMKIRNPFHQGQRRCELHETLQRWGISREGLGKLGAHLVPEPVCKLLLRGKWQDLLFMSRWFKGPFARRGSWAEEAGVRLPDALWAVAGEHEALQDLEPLELQHLQRMLDHIRRWSPAILAQCETEDAAAGEQLLLESSATWLRQLMAYFAPHFAENATDLRRHLGVRDAQHGLQLYSDRQLVGMVLFAWHLRDSVGFKEAAPSALEAMFPKFFSLTGFGTGRGVLKQSKTLLRSAQLSVDVALMLLRRKNFEEHPNIVRYGWADSSPIAQADWIICKHQAIASQSCVELFQACAELRSIEVDVSEKEEMERRVELCQQLLAEIRVHTQPPQAMALGLTAIESKLSALVFSFYLEVGTLQGLKTFLDSFVSFTTDMGTEFKTASFLVSDLRKLLPEWLAQPLLQRDVDMNDEDTGAFDAPVPFLPRAIIVPGALHICSNLCKDISKKLSHWPAFVNELSSFEAFCCVTVIDVKGLSRLASRRVRTNGISSARLVEACMKNDGVLSSVFSAN